MTTLYRWWRDLDVLGEGGRTAAVQRNTAMITVGITEGQTMTRMVLNHFCWHNPLTGGPTTGPSVMDIPNEWLIVWDDGTDSNMDSANIDYVLATKTHDILHQGVWHWSSVWGWGPVGSLQNQAAFWDGERDHVVEIRTSRKWRPGGANIQFPRYLSRARQTITSSIVLPYHTKLSVALLAATPNALP